MMGYNSWTVHTAVNNFSQWERSVLVVVFYKCFSQFVRIENLQENLPEFKHKAIAFNNGR